MNYDLKAHPTLYAEVMFRSRLEARWAAFFDIVKWDWQYEPIDLNGWSPDFRVKFPCGHSDCPEYHVLLVEVKPYFDLSEFEGHPCMRYLYGQIYDRNGRLTDKTIPADSSAAFGNDPDVTYWEMVHGAGGGIENVRNWVEGIDVDSAWKQAGNLVQYHPGGNT